MSTAAVTRVRMTRSALLAVFFFALCVSPLALTSPPAALLYVLPLLLAGWVLRAGVDVDTDGLTVHALFGARRLEWDDVAGLRLSQRGDVRLALHDGRSIRLPVVRTRHLPMLAAASGGRFDAP